MRVYPVLFYLGGKKSVVDFMLNKKKEKKTGKATRFLCIARVLCLIGAVLVTWCCFKCDLAQVKKILLIYIKHNKVTSKIFTT